MSANILTLESLALNILKNSFSEKIAEEIESTVNATPRSQNINNMMDISLALFGDFTIFQDTSQKKRVGESTSKLSSKKVKKQVSKEDFPILKKLIEELTSMIPENSEKQ
ncbi:10932_t:CDS:2 [Ambispora gerdemannii]|uniref:10932_t:CDS:1 n=1 Tax=Ambispora gerdemannii TaxID=144530 RepID=A0A9N9E5C6_9GLOM|nr:10932_t:CDS:2 [Ambispora gerdemannii]